MTQLPPEFSNLIKHIDDQPVRVQEAFHYCLCLMMMQAGKMDLVDTVTSNTITSYIFTTVEGEVFSIPRPAISPEEESALIQMLRAILIDEGLL